MLEKYTTTELKAKDIKEKDKTEITNEAYAVCEYLNEIINRLRLNK